MSGILGLLAIAAAGAAVGGGGGGGSDSDSRREPSPELPDNDDGDNDTSLPPSTPGPDTGPDRPIDDDNESSWNLSRIDAFTKYEQGVTGRGVRVGVVDTGVLSSHPDLSANLNSGLSRNFLRAGENPDINHGTHVAGIIAASRNGAGIHGVAYDSEIYSLRLIGGAVQSNAFADAWNYAIDNGTDVLNNSWTVLDRATRLSRRIDEFSGRAAIADYLGDNYLDALRRGASEGMISVWAVGNDAAPEPSVMAGLPLIIPELGPGWIAVGAVDSSNSHARFSNDCGAAMNFCLVAPGVSIESTTADGGYGYLSGTSMAAPHVAGAAALLRQEFPELAAGEVAQILFDSATDLGAPGVDRVFGHGLLNLKDAVAPAGDLKITTGDTVNGATALARNSRIEASGAIGAGLAARLQDHAMIVTDVYDRGYRVGLNSFVAKAAERGVPDLGKALGSFTRGLSTHGSALGITMRLDAGGQGASVALGVERATGTTSVTTGDLLNDQSSDWLQPSAFSADFSDLPDFDTRIRHSARLTSDLSVVASFGEGDGLSDISAGVNWTPVSGADLGVSVGTMDEQSAFLGSELTGAFSADSYTEFLRVNGSWSVYDDVSLHLAGSMGRSSLSGRQLITGSSDIRTDAFAVGMSFNSLLRADDRLVVGISQPLRVSGGSIRFDLPVAREVSDGRKPTTGVSRMQTDVPIASAGRQRDIQIAYRTYLDDRKRAALSLGAIYSTNPGHVSNVAAVFGVGMSLAVRF